jgi:hypothetical protein
MTTEAAESEQVDTSTTTEGEQGTGDTPAEVSQETTTETVTEEGNDVDDSAETIKVSFAGEEPPAEVSGPSAKWAEMRRSLKDLRRENEELKARTSKQVEAETAPTLPKFPTVDEFDYDVVKHRLAVEQWVEQKRKVDDHAAKSRAAAEKQQTRWSSRVENLKTRIAPIQSDYEDAAPVVERALSVVQQNLMIAALDDPALMTVALKRHPAKLKELAAIEDHAEFIARVAKLEVQLSSEKRTPSTPPERRVVGTAPKSGGVVDKTREKLDAEAERTKDRSKLAAYDREQRQKAKK